MIPVLNARETLAEQIEALLEQDFAGTWEVVIADNGSRDGTPDVIAGCSSRIPLILVDAAARRGPAAARNQGADHACGKILAFCDADDVVGPGWLAAHVAAMIEADVTAGAVIRYDPSQAGRAPRNPPRLLHFLPYASGSNMAVRRTTFDELGGFDETLLVGENVDFSWRAQLAGRKFEYRPDATVYKRKRSGVRSEARQYFRYGRHDSVLLHRYRAHGARREESVSEAARIYLGLIARLPALVNRDQRSRWARQLGRRSGRIVGPPRRLGRP